MSNTQQLQENNEVLAQLVTLLSNSPTCADFLEQLDAHIKDRNNPHKITTATIGAQTKITCGTAAPSGGVDGDVYIQIIE